MLLALCCFAEDTETFGCEANPTGNPIGGGKGYNNILSTGDYVVKNARDFLDALGKAKEGQVIFIPGETEIDLTGKKDLVLPAGVTLAGERGRNGCRGACIRDKQKKSHTLFKTGGYGIRVTGLHFHGPHPGRDRAAFYVYGISVSHSDIEIDNNEIHAFNTVGIGVSAFAINVQIHHNHIYDCTQNGLGYGVSTQSPDVHIIANIFNNCRHHIASSGAPGSFYEAAWNLVLEDAIGHHFDMHGGRDRGDGTNIAGDGVEIHHNTFRGTANHIVIRGVPSQGGSIHHNWFTNPPGIKSVRTISDDKNTDVNLKIYKNVHGAGKNPAD